MLQHSSTYLSLRPTPAPLVGSKGQNKSEGSHVAYQIKGNGA